MVSRLDANTAIGEREGIDITQIDFKKNSEIEELRIDPDRDLLYCAMNRTAQNLFLVLTLRTLYPDAKIVAISNSVENARKLTYAGADKVIDLYEATAHRITHSLTKPAVTKAIDEIIYHRSDIKLAELQLPPHSPLHGARLSEIDFRAQGVLLIAIIDKELGSEVVIADGGIDHHLDAGDILVLVGKEENLERFRTYVQGEGHA